MSAFVDASIIVAVIGRESDWVESSDLIEQHAPLLWSAITRWESIVSLRNRLREPIDVTRTIVDEFAAMNDFHMVTIEAPEAVGALEAFARYGKGSGHPAQLNMGDCFAYACAKTHGARLLYKGKDFSHTDMALE